MPHKPNRPHAGPAGRPLGPLPPELLTRGFTDARLMRAIINFFGHWGGCRAACRRAKRCTSATAACFDLNLEAIRESLAEIADWPRLDGPRDPEEANAPVTALWD